MTSKLIRLAQWQLSMWDCITDSIADSFFAGLGIGLQLLLLWGVK